MKRIWSQILPYALGAVAGSLGVLALLPSTPPLPSAPSAAQATPAPAPDTRLFLTDVSGDTALLPDGEENEWFAVAQGVANTKQQTLAVIQAGKLICLVPPSR